MASTYTPLGVELQATGENAGTWGTKTNTNLQLIEQITGGYIQKSIAGGAQTTALAVSDGSLNAELAHRMIEFTGTITGNQIVTIPLDVQTFYILKNSTSGAYTVQFKYASGSGDTFTFAATNKKTAIVQATADDSTNPNIIEIQTGGDVVDDTSPQLGGDLDVNGNDIVSTSNGNIDLLPNGTGKVIMDGNGSSGGVSVSDGLIDIRTGTGNVAKVKFYCESSNAHAQTLQASPHSAGSSAVVVLPTASGNLVGTGDSGTVTNAMLAGSIADSKLSTISTAGKVDIGALEIDGATDIGADLADADLFIVDDGAGGTERKTAASRIKTYVGAAAGAFSIDNLDIDGGTDINAALTTSDLIVVDDGAGGTNRKAALSRVVTLVSANIDDPTALAIALG